MRGIAVGIVIGAVIGIVLGATVIAPSLERRSRTAAEADTPETAPVAAGGAATNVPLGPASGPETVFTLASAFSAETPLIGDLATRLVDMTRIVSDGRVAFVFSAPGDPVPSEDLLDAVATGRVAAAFSSPGMWGDEIPALQLFGGIPFGPDAQEYLSWYDQGGGRTLFEAIYHERGVHSIVCGMIAPEAAGWFRRQVEATEDLSGIRIDIDGLGAKVLAKLGAEAGALRDGDAVAALEADEIDAVASGPPSMDLPLDFHKHARFYYFPGWHQPVTLLELMINLREWEQLPSRQRSQIETVCRDNIVLGLAESEAAQFAALRVLYADGVTLRRWPPLLLESLRQAWKEVVKEETPDDDFRDVWQSLQAFRTDYGIWRDLSRP